MLNPMIPHPTMTASKVFGDGRFCFPLMVHFHQHFSAPEDREVLEEERVFRCPHFSYPLQFSLYRMQIDCIKEEMKHPRTAIRKDARFFLAVEIIISSPAHRAQRILFRLDSGNS